MHIPLFLLTTVNRVAPVFFFNLVSASNARVSADWFEGLNIKTQVANPTYFNSVNTYGVHCGGDLHMWESSGWIKECDPYGWFQVHGVTPHPHVASGVIALLAFDTSGWDRRRWARGLGPHFSRGQQLRNNCERSIGLAFAFALHQRRQAARWVRCSTSSPFP